MVILDLGCGKHKAPHAVGIDRCALPGVDVVCDLNSPPYPLPSDYADEVHLSHILEHLANPIAVLEEVWRITKPGARVVVRVPHYSGIFAWRDPTHVRCFTTASFDYFGTNAYSYYTHARFRVAAVRLKYLLEPYPGRIIKIWGAVVQWVLDRRPAFSERFLAYLVGGIDEMVVTLETLKTGHTPQGWERGWQHPAGDARVPCAGPDSDLNEVGRAESL